MGEPLATPPSSSLDELKADIEVIDRYSAEDIEVWLANRRLDALVPFFDQAREDCAMPMEVVYAKATRNLAVIAGKLPGPLEVPIHYVFGQFWVGIQTDDHRPRALDREVGITEEVAKLILEGIETTYDPTRMAPVKTYRNLYPVRFNEFEGKRKDHPKTHIRFGVREVNKGPGDIQSRFVDGTSFKNMVQLMLIRAENRRTRGVLPLQDQFKVFYRGKWNSIIRDQSVEEGFRLEAA